MKKTGMVLLVITAVCLWFLLFSKESAEEIASPTIDQESSAPPKLEKEATPVQQIPATITGAATDFSPTAAVCKVLQKEISDQAQKYSGIGDTDTYLADGFSEEDVTFFLNKSNPNIARIRRDFARRRNSPLQQLNAEVWQLARQEIPDLPEQPKMILSVPQPWVEEAVNAGNVLRLEQNWQVLPGDVAWMIGQSDVDDKTIQDAIALMSDKNGVIGSDISPQKGAYNILESALMAGRGRLAEWMLNEGVEPASDSYLGSTLDAAVDGLLNAFSIYDEVLAPGTEADRQAVVRVIKQLAAQGQLMNAEYGKYIDPDTLYSRNGSVYNYIFETHALVTILNKTGLDIMAIPRSEAFSSERGEELVKLVRSRQSEMMQLALGDDYQLKQEKCWNFKDEVREKWAPKSFSYHRSDIADSELFSMAPELVSCRRQFRLQMKIFTVAPESELGDEILHHLEKKRFEKAHALLREHPKLKEYVFYNISHFLDGAYQSLAGAGLLPQLFDFSQFHFEDFRWLEEQGFDLYQTDKFGRSLLLVAIYHWSIEQLTFLSEREVPYYTGADMPDPLYFVLYQIATQGKRSNMIEMLSAIMAYDPVIEPMHFMQMHVLKLRDKPAYQEVVNAFSELDVGAEEPNYPEFTCRLRQ